MMTQLTTDAGVGPDPTPGYQHPTREKILRAWPDAVWFPWDEPPAGRRVTIRTETGDGVTVETGTVRGRARLSRKLCHCLTCTCERPEAAIDWWWEVEVDGWYYVGGDCVRTAEPPQDARPATMLKYPPSLLPLGDA